MKITVKLAFHERAALRLLNWLARENARLLRSDPELPNLYESGVVYRREDDETWCDILHLLAQGHEDCDGLAAARAGELMARGHRVLGPGDGGYHLARSRRIDSIPAEVMLTTRSPEGEPGLYHCVVRYVIDGTEYRDDPSARLGMNGGRIDPEVRRRVAARTSSGPRTWRTA